ESAMEANTEGTRWLTSRVSELKNALETAELEVSKFRAAAGVTSYEELELHSEQLKALRDRHAHSQTQIAQTEARLALLYNAVNNASPETAAAVAADPTLAEVIGVSGAASSQDADDGLGREQLFRIEADRIEADIDRERRLAE